MPWTPEDARRHDKKAKSPKAQRQWSDVANAVLKSTGDEGRAVREANGVVIHPRDEDLSRGARMKQDMAKFHGKASEASHKRPKRRVINRYV